MVIGAFVKTPLNKKARVDTLAFFAYAALMLTA
jgi:hypothetical protein